MALQQEWQDLLTNPQFSALNYDEQMYVKEQFLSKKLPAEEGFVNLSEDDRQRVFQTMLYTAPKTGADAQRQAVFETVYNETLKGDENAQKEALSWMTKETFRDQLSMLDLVSKAINWVDGRDGIKDVDMSVLGQEKPIRDKELEALRFALSQDQQTATKARRRNILATGGGMLVDTAIWYGATEPLGMALKSATGAGKILNIIRSTPIDEVARFPEGMNIVQKAIAGSYNLPSGLTRMATYNLTPVVLDGVRGGLIEVGRQNILNNYEKQASEDPDFWNTVAKNSAIFGEDFIYGITMFAGLNLLGKGVKQIAGMAKVLGKVQGSKMEKAVFNTMDEFDNYRFRTVVGNMTAEEIADLPEGVVKQNILDNLYLANVAKNVDRYAYDSPEFVGLFSALQQVKMVPDGKGKFIVDDLIDADYAAKTLSQQEAFYEVGRLIKQRKALDADALAESAINTDSVKIFNTLTTPVANFKSGLSKKELAKMISPLGQRVNPNNAGFVAREMMKQAGLSDEIIDGVKISTPNGMKVKLDAKTRIEIPSSIKTAAEEEAYLKTMFKGIRQVIERHEGNTEVVDSFEKIMKSTLPERGFTPTWIEVNAKKLGGKIEVDKGKYIYTNAAGDVGTYTDYNRLGQEIFHGVMRSDEGVYKTQIAQYAKDNFGANVKELPDGRVEVSKRGRQKKPITETYDSFDSLVEIHPELLPKLPSSLITRWNVTDNTMKTISTSANVVSGDTNSVMIYADQFKNVNRFSKSKINKMVGHKLLQHDDITAKMVVTDTHMNHMFTSDNPSDIGKYLQRTYDNYEDNRVMAAYKGANVMAVHGKYYLYQAGGTNATILDNVEDLRKAVADLPSPNYVPKELSGFDYLSDELARSVGKYNVNTQEVGDFRTAIANLIEKGKKITLKKDEEARLIPLGTYAYKNFGPRDIYQKRMAEVNKNPEYYEQLHTVRRRNQQFEGVSYRSMKALDENVYAGMSKADDEMLSTVLTGKSPSETFEQAWKRLSGKEASGDMIERYGRLRKTFDDYRRIFGVDGWKYLNDYFPQIKKMAFEKGGEFSDTIENSWKTFIGPHVPEEVKFFARNVRLGDVMIQNAMKKSSDITKYYIRNGLKSTMMGETIDLANDWLKKNHKVLDQSARWEYATYMNRIMGIFDENDISAFNKAMYATAKDFFEKMKIEGVVSKVIDDHDLQNLLGFFNSVTISATMAYRPWPVIRNLFQPFNTLGLLVGQDTVMDAYKMAIKEPAKRAERLKRLGILSERNHMIMSESDTMLRKFTDTGLSVYQSSHGVNLAVTDAVAELSLKKSLKYYEKNGDLTEFLRRSNLDRINPQDQSLVLKSIQEGNIEKAIDDYSEILIHRTQFPYKTWENPEAFQGLIGKLFGAYQHYPVYYTANLLSSMRHGPTEVIIGNLFRTALTGGILYSTLNKFTGIDAKDFLFYTPVSFSGGPLWAMANDILALTSGGYESEVALDQLKRNVPSLLIPGAGMGKSIYEGLQGLAEGDYQKFFIKALSAPLGRNF